MKTFFAKSTKFILGALAIVIILAAIAFAITRSAFTSINHYQSEIEKKATVALNRPVKIGSIELGWRGVNPVFTLNHLVVYGNAKMIPIVQVERIQIGINLLVSLIHWRWTVNKLYADGTHLIVYQLGANQFDINGINANFSKTQTANRYFENMTSWLLNEGDITLSNVSMDWYDIKGRKFVLQDLQVKLFNGIISRHLIGLAKVIQPPKKLITARQNQLPSAVPPMAIRFVVDLKGNVFDSSQLEAKIYLYIKGMKLYPWLEGQAMLGWTLQKGHLNYLQIWANWNHDKLNDVQTVFSTNNLSFISDKTNTPLNIPNFSGNFYWIRQKESWLLAGDNLHLQTQLWNKIPGINHLDGQFTLTPQNSRIQLAGENVQLDFGRLFRRNLPIYNYKIDLQWQKMDNHWQLQANNIEMKIPGMNLHGEMTLNSEGEDNTNMALLLGYNAQNMIDLKQYIPITVFPPKLVSWLNQSILAGSIDGAVLISGPPSQFPFDNKNGKFEVLANLHQMNFNYMNGWPMISGLSGEMMIDGRSIQININGGQISGNEIISAQGTIADVRRTILEINGLVSGDSAQGLEFIHKSPLEKKLGSSLTGLKLQGPMRVNLQLHIPLDKQAGDAFALHGNVELFKDNILQLPAWNLELNQLTGFFQFTADTLTAQNMQGQFLGSPITLNIDTQRTKTTDSSINIHIGGNVAVDVLREKYKADFLKYFQGTTDYLATIKLMTIGQVKKDVVEIDSDLRGIVLDLPMPLKKTADEKTPFHLEMDIAEKNKLGILMSYNSNLSAALLFQKNKAGLKFDNAEVRLGKTPATFQNVPGILISGDLPTLTTNDLQSYFSQIKKQTAGAGDVSSFKKLLRQINLTIGKVDLSGLLISPAHIQLSPNETGWLFQLQSPTIIGRLTIPDHYPAGLVEGDFEKINLMPMTSQTPSKIKPDDIPPLNIICHNFNYGEKHFGQVRLITSRAHGAMSIDQLRLQSPVVNMTAHGEWIDQQGDQQTSLYGQITSNDLGAALKSWGATGSMAEGKGDAKFNLTWQGAAYSPKLSLMNGNLSLSFRDGRIINISQSAQRELGLGRVLNLLSLQTLPRRLTFNFSDLTTKGFSFDTLKGDFEFKMGNAFTQNLLLNGPVAKVGVTGRIGIAQGDYDLLLSITPYVTSSLPIIATIAGGPIAGAVTWVANKVLSGAVNKISSQIYKVTGPWENPQVDKVNESLSRYRRIALETNRAIPAEKPR